MLTLLVNGEELCDPLGDKNVWGTLFELPQELPQEGIVMLATKVWTRRERERESVCVCVCV